MVLSRGGADLNEAITWENVKNSKTIGSLGHQILIFNIFPLLQYSLQVGFKQTMQGKESLEEIRKRREKLKNTSGQPEDDWAVLEDWQVKVLQSSSPFLRTLLLASGNQTLWHPLEKLAMASTHVWVVPKSCSPATEGCRSPVVQELHDPWTSWSLIPRVSPALLSKITWGDHGGPSFGQKFMKHTACIEKIWTKMGKKGGERNERNQSGLFTFS